MTKNSTNIPTQQQMKKQMTEQSKNMQQMHNNMSSQMKKALSNSKNK